MREAVLAVAPELSGVRPVRTAAAGDAVFIPLDIVGRRPVTAGGPP